MRCRSGRHEWVGSLDASRCCSQKWRREVRLWGARDELDPEGRLPVRLGPYLLYYGWVRTPDEIDEIEPFPS